MHGFKYLQGLGFGVLLQTGAFQFQNRRFVSQQNLYRPTSLFITANSRVTNKDDELNDDPICQVVAKSDGKIPTHREFLSPSSASLLERVELLYSVQSQKELKALAYTNTEVYRAKSYLGSINNDNNNNNQTLNITLITSDDDLKIEQEDEEEKKLISILKQSLEDGGFKLLKQRDLDLCSALNAGYLLRLSLLPDTRYLDPCIGQEFYPELYADDDDAAKAANEKRATNNNNRLLFDGRVLVFRRGYFKEISNGRLLLPKLDYLQASLVQRSTSSVTRKLGAFEQKLEQYVLSVVTQLSNTVENAYLQIVQQLKEFTIKILENFGLYKNEIAGLSQNKETNTSSKASEDISLSSKTSILNMRGNKIFKFGRYQTATSSSLLDLDDALSPFLLCELGNGNATDIVNGAAVAGQIICQYDDLLDTTLESLYKPSAVRLLERTSIENTVSIFSTKGRRELIKNYFRTSTLVEPGYEEVIVVWRPMRKKKPKQINPPKWLYEVAKVFDMEDRLPKRNNTQTVDDHQPMPLKIKAFTDVPMANVEAVLPKNKLLFRAADALVFDVISLFSFLAVAGSLKFDSPKLDLIAFVSLIFFAIRTFFRYSNKYARYDLLVNKFLTSKISHRDSGALNFIASEANTNKAWRAILVREWLLKSRPARLDDIDVKEGERYVNELLGLGGSSQIDVDILSAVNDLTKLNLITQSKVKDDDEAYDTLKQLWSCTFDKLEMEKQRITT